MCPRGASSSVASHRAFQGLTRNTARDCALFLLPRSRRGQKERMATGASEKLAQEGLRGNRDRLAVGSRVPHARPVGRSPRDRRMVGSRVPRDHTGGSPRARRPACRPVRIHDNSNHRNGLAFQKHGRGLCPSFLSRKQNRGQRKSRGVA